MDKHPIVGLPEDQPRIDREKSFESDKAIISQLIKMGSQTTVGCLQIKSRINSTDEYSQKLPMRAFNPFRIAIANVDLPAKCGGGSLMQRIFELCTEHNIEINASFRHATCRSVVVALAGQYDITDMECTGPKKAEFVPIYRPNTTQQSYNNQGVLVFCYSEEGKGLTELSDDQKNIYGIVFIEYDEKILHDGMPICSSSSGSSGQILSLLSTEKGNTATRTLRNIQIYLVEPLIVNNKYDNSSSLFNTMRERAQAIDNNCVPPIRSYYWLEEIQSHLSSMYELVSYESCRRIVASAILKMGAEREIIPQAYEIVRSTIFPEHFYIALVMSDPESVFRACDDLSCFSNWKIFIATSEFLEEFPTTNNKDVKALLVAYSSFSNCIVAVKRAVDSVLNPRRLAAEKIAESKSESLCNQFQKKMDVLLNVWHLNSRNADAVEAVLLHMFDCKEQCTKATFSTGKKNYVDKLLDVHFSFDISPDAARELVHRINVFFPDFGNPALFLNDNMQIDNSLSHISIDGQCLLSTAFEQLFIESMQSLFEQNPCLLEKFQKQSGYQTCSSEESNAQGSCRP